LESLKQKKKIARHLAKVSEILDFLDLIGTKPVQEDSLESECRWSKQSWNKMAKTL